MGRLALASLRGDGSADGPGWLNPLQAGLDERLPFGLYLGNVAMGRLGKRLRRGERDAAEVKNPDENDERKARE